MTNSKTRKIKKKTEGLKPKDLVKKCNDSYCKKFGERWIKEIKDTINMLESIKEKTPEEKKLIVKMKSNLKSGVSLKKSLKSCRNRFCNIDCKGTIFEDGDGNKLPPSVIRFIKQFAKGKTRKTMTDLIANSRRELFQNKKTVLRDNFYEKLNGILKLKKEGAISGCLKRVIIHD
jgi:hypothetical protein